MTPTDPAHTPPDDPPGRPRRLAPRRRPALAITLTAAALAGELAVATLATADEAHAQVDEPAAAPAQGAPDPSPAEAPDDRGAPDEPSDPPPEPAEPPDDAGAPADPPAATTPDLPAAPPAAAVPPVRTGSSADGARLPDAVPAAVRDGRDDGHEHERASDAGTQRTGHDDAPTRATDAPARDGRTRAPGRRKDAAGTAAEHRRSGRGGAPRPSTGASASAGALPAWHEIAPGEHLWSIAAARVGEITGRDPSSLAVEEIAPYWTRLCMTNEARLRSGNLNLVYPGELIELPPL